MRDSGAWGLALVGVCLGLLWVQWGRVGQETSKKDRDGKAHTVDHRTHTLLAFGGLGTRGPKTRRAAINDPGAFGSDPRNPRLNPSGLGCGRVHETVSARVATTEERYQFAEVRRTLLVVLDIERITRATTNTVIEVVHLIDRANQYRLRYTVPYRPDVP